MDSATPPRALVVDDNLVNLEVAGTLLKREGWAVSTVESGSAALALLADQTFDVVLLDLSMPGMSGEETCRRIRTDQRLQSLYVIAYTAHALEHERERILACGFDDILVKPVSRAALLAAVAARP